MPQTLALENLPPTHILHIGLYTSVTNSAYIHSQLLAKNQTYEYAFIDASILVSKLQALAAAYRAIHDLIEPTIGLRTPNVHSETVFSLSPSHNITDSYRRFGISPASTTVLAIKVLDSTLPSYSSTTALDDLSSIVDGEEIPFTDESIRSYTDVAKVKKYYKIKDHPATFGVNTKKGAAGNKGVELPKKSVEEEWRDLEVAVLGAMALRSLV